MECEAFLWQCKIIAETFFINSYHSSVILRLTLFDKKLPKKRLLIALINRNLNHLDVQQLIREPNILWAKRVEREHEIKTKRPKPLRFRHLSLSEAQSSSHFSGRESLKLIFFHSQDGALTWVETDPELTVCFMQTALIWVPCGFLFLFAILDVYVRFRSRYSDIPWSFLNVSKSIVLFLLICLTFYDMAMLVTNWDTAKVYDVHIVAVSVKAVAFVSCHPLSLSFSIALF